MYEISRQAETHRQRDSKKERQTDRQMDRQTGWLTHRQTNRHRQACRQADNQCDGLTCNVLNKQTEGETDIGRKEKQLFKLTGRQTEIWTDWEICKSFTYPTPLTTS